ncbi:GNAT family N-acetyltransferase [Paramaledivibacter caminithermalis]|uniref:Acetyltransferase (GNAT) family protein n=1 Tax=Paramaledivibacter caminithermalis (strain DSM 15212 / CIP 107654 / DViRD3) TaxID=1121301 RepID=A0A1M6R336_PARC5|nr:GNAT family N-acetyltransferase [Paramaledivibacter caminithermalis]SHK26747.1 Acetyltransferase (GNAT) family protein [Paramaledivibacter caminithermalis DSM 15212]
MDSAKKSIFQLKNYKVKKLDFEKDLKALLQLCENCKDFYELNGIESVNLETAKEIFKELPPGKEYDSKMVIGVYNDKDTLIGIIEGVTDFPENYTWYIGQMMISVDYRNKGLGEEFYRGFEKWAVMNSVNCIKLGVLEENTNGLRFWKRMGFRIIKKIDNFKIGNIETTAFKMENDLK